MGNFFYYFCRDLFRLPLRPVTRFHYAGREHVPLTGPALLLSNHISHFDPPYLAAACPRVIHFMADKPLLEIPIYGRILRRAGVFPVDRTKNDIGALKTAMKLLKNGEVVCIFPEEGIRQEETSVLGGAEMPVGTASLWKKTGVPVIPMVVLGTDQLYAFKKYWRFPRWRVFVRVGKPIPCDPDATREELRDRIAAAWRELYDGLVRDYQIRPEELPITAQERWGQPKPERAAAK